MITPKQCRAARALLDWDQHKLAKGASVGRSTIARFEHGEVTPVTNNMKAIEMAFQTVGIVFVGTTGVDLPEK